MYLLTKWSFNSKVHETVKYSNNNEKIKLKKQVIKNEKNSPSFLLINKLRLFTFKF